MGHVPPQYSKHFQTLLGTPPTPNTTTSEPVLASENPLAQTADLATNLCHIWSQSIHHLTSHFFNSIFSQVSNCGGVSYVGRT
jgi:hypothetical protein